MVTEVTARPFPFRATELYTGVWRQLEFFFRLLWRELAVCAETCFASYLIGWRRSVPPWRPSRGLGLVETAERLASRQQPLCGAGRPGKFLRACRGAAGERQRGAAGDGLRSGRRVVPRWAPRSRLLSSGTALRSASGGAGASTRSIARSPGRPSPPPPVSPRSLLASLR